MGPGPSVRKNVRETVLVLSVLGITKYHARELSEYVDYGAVSSRDGWNKRVLCYPYSVLSRILMCYLLLCYRVAHCQRACLANSVLL